MTQLVRLNRELDSLYEFIYDDWRTITEEDYKMFGGQFVILIQTIKQLYDACKKQPKAMGLNEETKRLGMNYSALYELNSDIVNFCIKMPWRRERSIVLLLSSARRKKQRSIHPNQAFPYMGRM